MKVYKKYLLLKLIDGGLILESGIKPNPAIKEIAKQENISTRQIKSGHNISNPIPYTTLSNMLTVLMGGIPVPTKPKKNVHSITKSKGLKFVMNSL